MIKRKIIHIKIKLNGMRIYETSFVDSHDSYNFNSSRLQSR
ncbi:hypothetical protein STAPHY8AQ_20107 [Staphylococcus sp. 8AQ]|nr:hypothetical protein STAPHY8AQ_20107 [Staphylococcus sp. 8AQ]